MGSFNGNHPFIIMAIKSIKYILAIFVLIQSWNTVRSAPKPQFNIDFNGSIGTNHNNDCKVAGSCSFGGGSTPGRVTTTNTRVNGSATFNTDFNGPVGTSHISSCQQDGSCRFQVKRSAPDDIIIPLLKTVTQKRQPRQISVAFKGSVGTSHVSDCRVAGSCQFGSSDTPVSTVNTDVTGTAQFHTNFNGPVGTSHISDCQRNGSCSFSKKKRSIETDEA